MPPWTLILLHKGNILSVHMGRPLKSTVCFSWFFMSQSIIFQPWRDVFLGWTSTKQRIKCLAQGHNAVSPVSLELAILTLYQLSHCASLLIVHMGDIWQKYYWLTEMLPLINFAGEHGKCCWSYILLVHFEMHVDTSCKCHSKYSSPIHIGMTYQTFYCQY